MVHWSSGSQPCLGIRTSQELIKKKNTETQAPPAESNSVGAQAWVILKTLWYGESFLVMGFKERVG